MKEELFALVGKIMIENKEANDRIEDTTGKAKEGGNSMAESFKKVGAAVATYLTVEKIISFGKACVEAAAEVQAQNAQFEASFKELQGEAKAAFKAVSEETGILATRLQTEGTKAFSMFKGAGMDATDALKQSERFLGLAADAAAYYDISLEEASERVLGFAKGNFENGDAIGVFTNETQRNAIAMEKYGKKFAELTEAQKQALSLDMIENTYELSGAIGQASREADGYENVMGNLNEAWRQFKAVIGGPILEQVIPVIKGMTNAVTELTNYLPTMTSNFKSALEPIKAWFQPIVDEVKKLWSALKESWEVIFPSLQNAWKTASSILEDVWNNILKPVFDFLKKVALDTIGAISENLPEISRIFSEVVDTLASAWEKILKPVFEAIGDFVQNTLLPIWEEVWEKIKVAASVVFDALVKLWDETLKPLLDEIIDFISNVFSGDWSAAWENVKEIVSTIFTAIWEAIKNIFSKIWSVVQNKVDEIKGKISDGFNEAWKTVKQVFTNIYDKIKEKIEAARDTVESAINKIKSFFDFEWSLPKLKLPHISITGEWSLRPPSSPKFSVDWYAKGGILEKPTVFGVNPVSGNAMVGGEAGKEAVAPIEELMGYVRRAVDESNGGVVEVLIKIFELLSDDDRLKNIFIEALMNGEFKVELDNREVGRIVRQYA